MNHNHIEPNCWFCEHEKLYPAAIKSRILLLTIKEMGYETIELSLNKEDCDLSGYPDLHKENK